MRSAMLLFLYCAVCVAQGPAGPVNADKVGLKGEWVATLVAGPPELQEAVKESKKFSVTVEGDKLVLRAGEGKDDVYSFKLDASKVPKAIDFYRNDQLVSRGIYALEGDKLQLCAGLSQWISDVANKFQVVEKVDDRPTAFEARRGLLLMLVRTKGK